MEMTTIDTDKSFGIVAPAPSAEDEDAWADLDARYNAAMAGFEKAIRIELGSASDRSVKPSISVRE
jgi:hypothetical protein